MSERAFGTVWVRHAEVARVRNLHDQAIEPGRGINVVFGDNGHGKTSLLEAVYLMATSKSFRTPRLREVTAHGRKGFSVRAALVEERPTAPPLAYVQVVAFEDGALRASIDGNRPESSAAFARRTPVVVFHPDELQLSTGPAALRRKLLDRVALYRGGVGHAAAQRYARALRARQELLRRPASSEGEIASYETIAAEAGAELTRARSEAAAALEPHLCDAFRRIAAPELRLDIAYEPGGSDDPERNREELCARRARDARSPAASFGPHRDELELALDARPARHVASQGQHRAIALALKAAECATIAESTRLWPIQLFDDVSSELDANRTEALFSFLRETRGQLFVTTTRPELIERAIESNNSFYFRLLRGALERV